MILVPTVVVERSYLGLGNLTKGWQILVVALECCRSGFLV